MVETNWNDPDDWSGLPTDWLRKSARWWLRFGIIVSVVASVGLAISLYCFTHSAIVLGTIYLIGGAFLAYIAADSFRHRGLRLRGIRKQEGR